MVCFNCGKEISEDICPYCGKTIKKSINNKDYNKISKNIIYIFFGSVFLIVILFLIISNNNHNKFLKKQNDFVNNFCNKNYIDNVSISNVIDDYSCEKYASYMYDTKGSELSFNQIDKLIINNDINIFKIYYDVTGEDVSTLYKDIIYQNSYYDFLYQYKLTKIINSKEYMNIISKSIEESNFILYKSVLNCYFFKYNDFENPEKFFGSSKITSNDDDIDKIRENALKVDFVIEYKKHVKYYPIVFMFNEVLFDKAKDDKDFKKMILRSASLLSFSDIENYYKWGGKFYEEKMDPILYYVLNLNKNDIDVYKKIKFITDISKKDGYDVTYSDALDTFLGKYSNKKDKVYYDTYNALKTEGFKCYRNCYYERDFK